MAFKLDDIIIDRIQYGVAEDFNGKLLYTLTQLADATIDITAESKDAVDSTGTLIKRFWQAKAGEFTANNAMINLNILGSAAGTGKKTAGAGDLAIAMPKIITVKAGETVEIKDAEGEIVVNALGLNGSMGKPYTQAETPSATEFGFVEDTGVLTPPTDTEETQYIIKYTRKVESGVAITNKADAFPGTVKLTLKALCVDPCSADTLRACYIVLPSFQVSPEVSLSLTTDTQMEYKGSLQVNYCSADKELYSVYIAEDDVE